MTDNNTLPLVSIVVPSFNRRDFLRICLKSLVEQTYPNCEIVVADDGSTDGTGQMIAAEFPQVRYFYQENAGTAAAKNNAVQKARGEFIVFNDSDDVFLPCAVEKLVNALPRETHSACTYGSYWTINAEGIRQQTKRKIKVLPSGNIMGNLLEHIIVTNCGTLIPRDLFLEIGGFDHSLRVAEDYNLFLELAARVPFYAVSEPIYLRRRHSSNLSQANYSKSKIVLSVFDNFVRKNPEIAEKHAKIIKRRYSDLHNKLYREAKREQMFAEALEHAKAAWSYHFGIKQLFRLFTAKSDARKYQK